MNSQTIMIIVAVFGVGFLMMIPFGIMQSKRKKKAANFATNNSEKAILHLYANSPVIDGAKIKDMEHIRGEDLQYMVALAPGKHNVSAKYTCTDPGFGKNVNYKTPKPIESEILLEAGHEYTLGIYFYSPEERKGYYKGDVGEDIHSQALSISSGGSTRAYVICYKEK